MLHNGAKPKFLLKLLIYSLLFLCQSFNVVDFLHTLW